MLKIFKAACHAVSLHYEERAKYMYIVGTWGINLHSECDCALTCSPHREAAFIRKVVCAAAWPSTHHLAPKGASPRALSGPPAPLSTHCTYRHKRACTLMLPLCNNCQRELSGEGGLQPSCSAVPPAGFLTEPRYWDSFWEQQERDRESWGTQSDLLGRLDFTLS